MTLKGRNFLKLMDFTPEEITYLIDLSAELKEKKHQGIMHDSLVGKNIALIFEKTSTRTRCSFEVAAHDLGMHVTYLDPSGSQIGKKESIPDTARVLGRMFDGIEYRGYGQEIVEELAEYGMIEDLSDSYQEATSSRIKSMYSSYGKELLESVTIDGKLMALPSTQVYYGCNLFWVREDWRKELGLSEPSTLADVEQIIQAFRENDPGGNGNIGLPCVATLYGDGSSNFSVDPVFAAFLRHIFNEM